MPGSYIWRTLSLVIWEEKQIAIGGYLVWWISSFIVRIKINNSIGSDFNLAVGAKSTKPPNVPLVQ